MPTATTISHPPSHPPSHAPGRAARRLRAILGAPQDIASLAAFRILFGTLMLASNVRFLANGWVERFFGEPTFTFKFWGFAWVELPAPGVTYALFVGMAILALLIALGLFYRVAIVGFFLAFTYVELIDVTNYLNHYYLVSLLALLMCFLPAHRAWSLDALRKPALRATHVPAWTTGLLKGQLVLVYVFAAVAKAQGDWLAHAQPLNIWLGSRTDMPLVGSLLDEHAVQMAFSWAGFLHDLLVPIGLLFRRTRVWAWVALVVFHVATGILFPIGMFPVIMIVSTTAFFAPSWPRRFLPAKWRARRPETVPRPWRLPGGWRGKVATGLAVAWCLFHVLVPLRFALYGGDVLWHEQGMRWSWRVMVRDKAGSVTYRVSAREWQGERHVTPRRYLTAFQEREMSGQPDLILQLAHHIATEQRAAGYHDVAVRVDALVSLNGRAAVPLIDPAVDLTTVGDGLAKAGWILPAPDGPPRHLRPASSLATNERPRR